MLLGKDLSNVQQVWALAEKGYEVVAGPFDSGLSDVIGAIDRAVAEAGSDDIHKGSTGTSIRVDGVAERAPALVALLKHPPLLAAASAIIGPRFRKGSFHFRSVLPGAAAQPLHQDVEPGGEGWPLVAFIFMVDAFSPENGATRLVPGSERLTRMPAEWRHRHPAEEHANGPAGSMLLFNGSLWHGFGANATRRPRRSIYGSLVPASISNGGNR